VLATCIRIQGSRPSATVIRRAIGIGLALIGLSAPICAYAQRSVWVGVMVIYQAPSDAIDWRGPWTRSKAFVNPTFFSSEAECRQTLELLIRKMNEGMRAPIRYQCAPFFESLP
jgi:hypothetical protein